MWILKNYNPNLPGSYFYEQSQGIARSFRASPSIEELSKSVSSFRVANHLQRASQQECLEDIDAFTCARLGNSTEWCKQTADSFEQAHSEHAFFVKACSTCGTPVQTT